MIFFICLNLFVLSFPGSDKFNYIPGRTYEFQYDTEIGTSVQGSSEDHAGVHMSATVHMEVHSKCELVMRVCQPIYSPADKSA